MNNIKPISSMTTPRFADVATFFRLPIIKDLKNLDYSVCGVPWDGGTTNRPGARHGPREVRNASSLIRLYHPVSLKSPYDNFNIAFHDCNFHLFNMVPLAVHNYQQLLTIGVGHYQLSLVNRQMMIVQN